MASTGRRKSKVKSQKPKELYSKLLRHLKWYVYFRRVVLGNRISLDAINWADVGIARRRHRDRLGENQYLRNHLQNKSKVRVCYGFSLTHRVM
ncbi:hypothetical protein [Nostoc sp.]|uniref:hypothetical protein n=1 Tax=Nostoc sp. TaxID=1180 RepID=UPI002FF44A11